LKKGQLPRVSGESTSNGRPWSIGWCVTK
jgi:hypothetical protein